VIMSLNRYIGWELGKHGKHTIELSSWKHVSIVLVFTIHCASQGGLSQGH